MSGELSTAEKRFFGWLGGAFVAVMVVGSLVIEFTKKDVPISAEDDLTPPPFNWSNPDSVRSLFYLTILADDYVCPRVERVAHQGLTPRGDVYKVWCGKEKEPGEINWDLIYRVTVTPSERLLVRPWY